MDFDFTIEQSMLHTTTREMLERESSPRAVRTLMAESAGYSEATWRQLAEMGLLGVAIDDALDGQGQGMIELAIVLDEMGRTAYPGPYFATVVLAASVISAGNAPEQQHRYLPPIARGELKATLALHEDRGAWEASGVNLQAREHQDGYLLSGVKRFVPFAEAANLILVAARTSAADDPRRGITIFALERDTPGLSIAPNRSLDLTNRVATVRLDNVRLGAEAVVGRPGEGWPILEAALRRAAIGASAEMLGAARRCLELSVEYAKVREQFGQPIGAFQAIKHACAEMLMQVENSHAAVYYAAWALDVGAPDAAYAASVAKSYVSEAARAVCGAAIQVHGGIGFTWEYDLQLYFKRAKHFEALYGDAEQHRELLLREALQQTAVSVTA